MDTGREAGRRDQAEPGDPLGAIQKGGPSGTGTLGIGRQEETWVRV